jgi:hypothetical protein
LLRRKIINMKLLINSILFTAFLGITSCSQPANSDQTASDTSSVFDTTRLNTGLDTTAVEDVKANGATQSAAPTQHEEANGKQSPRTNVGADTTGKQEHDNKPK